MPKFLYTAKSIETGQPSSGELVAKDEKELAQDLRGQGLLLTSHRAIEEATKMNIKFLDGLMSVPLKEKMVFTRNLAVMVASGLTLSRGIHNLSLQTSHKGFKKILQDVFDEVSFRSISEVSKSF
jgi:type II secretory pathway component PulF